MQKMRIFHSTVNDVYFSVADDDEVGIGFINDPTVQPFIVEVKEGEYKNLPEDVKEAFNLGMDVVQNEEVLPSVKENEPKRRGRKPASDGAVVEID